MTPQCWRILQTLLDELHCSARQLIWYNGPMSTRIDPRDRTYYSSSKLPLPSKLQFIDPSTWIFRGCNVLHFPDFYSKHRSLIRRGAPVNGRDLHTDETPLSRAVSSKTFTVNIVRTLCKARADILAVDKLGRTCLDVVNPCMENRFEVIRELMNHGAEWCILATSDGDPMMTDPTERESRYMAAMVRRFVRNLSYMVYRCVGQDVDDIVSDYALPEWALSNDDDA